MLPGLVRTRNHLDYFFDATFQQSLKGPFQESCTLEDGPEFIDQVKCFGRWHLNASVAPVLSNYLYKPEANNL